MFGQVFYRLWNGTKRDTKRKHFENNCTRQCTWFEFSGLCGSKWISFTQCWLREGSLWQYGLAQVSNSELILTDENENNKGAKERISIFFYLFLSPFDSQSLKIRDPFLICPMHRPKWAYFPLPSSYRHRMGRHLIRFRQSSPNHQNPTRQRRHLLCTNCAHRSCSYSISHTISSHSLRSPHPISRRHLRARSTDHWISSHEWIAAFDLYFPKRTPCPRCFGNRPRLPRTGPVVPCLAPTDRRAMLPGNTVKCKQHESKFPHKWQSKYGLSSPESMLDTIFAFPTAFRWTCKSISTNRRILSVADNFAFPSSIESSTRG